MANEIIKVLDELCEKFGIAIDWTSDNALPYIQELCGKYINYEIWTSALCILAWGVALIGSIIFFTNKNKAMKNFLNKDERIDFFDAFYGHMIGWIWVLSLTIFITTIISFIYVVIIQSEDIITCLTFPEKMILEYIQGFLSSPSGQ